MYEDKKRKEYLKKLNAYADELIRDSKKTSSLLQTAGIITKSGHLTRPYRGMSVDCVSYPD